MMAPLTVGLSWDRMSQTRAVAPAKVPGDSYAATDTAAFLADIGKDLTIVTENREFAADCEVIHMQN